MGGGAIHGGMEALESDHDLREGRPSVEVEKAMEDIVGGKVAKPALAHPCHAGVIGVVNGLLKKLGEDELNGLKVVVEGAGGIKLRPLDLDEAIRDGTGQRLEADARVRGLDPPIVLDERMLLHRPEIQREPLVTMEGVRDLLQRVD